MKNICDWNNCKNPGEYKAPKEKDNSKKFRMLCLKHIKEFNKNWNYFSGMSDSQVTDFLKSDMTWHKPTQSFSSSDNFFKVLWNNTRVKCWNEMGRNTGKIQSTCQKISP